MEQIERRTTAKLDSWDIVEQAPAEVKDADREARRRLLWNQLSEWREIQSLAQTALGSFALESGGESVHDFPHIYFSQELEPGRMQIVLTSDAQNPNGYYFLQASAQTLARPSVNKFLFGSEKDLPCSQIDRNFTYRQTLQLILAADVVKQYIHSLLSNLEFRQQGEHIFSTVGLENIVARRIDDQYQTLEVRGDKLNQSLTRFLTAYLLSAKFGFELNNTTYRTLIQQTGQPEISFKILNLHTQLSAKDPILGVQFIQSALQALRNSEPELIREFIQVNLDLKISMEDLLKMAFDITA